MSEQTKEDLHTISFTLNGKTVSAPAGQMLVDAAADHGVYIPTLCYKRGEPCLGTCRVCVAQVNDKAVAACTVPVADGLQVDTQSEQVQDTQKAVVELLFVEGNHNCPSCEKSGACDLQAVGYEVGMKVARFDYRYTHFENQSDANTLWLERDRCIFCQRCVQFVHDASSGEKIFSICGRGHEARIVMDVSLANKLSDTDAQKAVELCPVGAILYKNAAYHHPMGERKFDIASVRERALSKEGAPL